MTKRKRRGVAAAVTAVERFEAPAKEGPNQEFVREVIYEGSGLGETKRFRNLNEHPLTLARARGKITAEEYAAGYRYRSLCAQVKGKDSTQERVGGKSAVVLWPQEHAADASKALVAIDAAIGRDNKRILRSFCGDGAAMGEAVMRAVPCHPSGVLWRLREALKALSDAFHTLGMRAST